MWTAPSTDAVGDGFGVVIKTLATREGGTDLRDPELHAGTFWNPIATVAQLNGCGMMTMAQSRFVKHLSTGESRAQLTTVQRYAYQTHALPSTEVNSKYTSLGTVKG